MGPASSSSSKAAFVAADGQLEESGLLQPLYAPCMYDDGNDAGWQKKLVGSGINKAEADYCDLACVAGGSRERERMRETGGDFK